MARTLRHRRCQPRVPDAVGVGVETSDMVMPRALTSARSLRRHAGEKDRAGEQEIHADEAYTGITRLEAMRELLRQHDQRGSIAIARHMQSAPNDGESHFIRGHKGPEARPR